MQAVRQLRWELEGECQMKTARLTSELLSSTQTGSIQEHARDKILFMNGFQMTRALNKGWSSFREIWNGLRMILEQEQACKLNTGPLWVFVIQINPPLSPTWVLGETAKLAETYFQVDWKSSLRNPESGSTNPGLSLWCLNWSSTRVQRGLAVWPFSSLDKYKYTTSLGTLRAPSSSHITGLVMLFSQCKPTSMDFVRMF